MVILLVILASLGVALARGGHLSNLAVLNVRASYLLFVPLVLQLIIYSPLPQVWQVESSSTPFVYIFSMAVGAVVVALNLRLTGLKVLLIGLLSNLVVIVANGGYMPVSMTARAIAGLSSFTGVYNNVVEMTNATPLWFLGDVLPLPPGLPVSNVFSVGDALIGVGGFIFLQAALVKRTAVIIPDSRGASESEGKRNN